LVEDELSAEELADEFSADDLDADERLRVADSAGSCPEAS
jgi:hypothetical protein